MIAISFVISSAPSTAPVQAMLEMTIDPTRAWAMNLEPLAEPCRGVDDVYSAAGRAATPDPAVVFSVNSCKPSS